jgi:hypothetical protein
LQGNAGMTKPQFLRSLPFKPGNKWPPLSRLKQPINISLSKHTSTSFGRIDLQSARNLLSLEGPLHGINPLNIGRTPGRFQVQSQDFLDWMIASPPRCTSKEEKEHWETELSIGSTK